MAVLKEDRKLGSISTKELWIRKFNALHDAFAVIEEDK